MATRLTLLQIVQQFAARTGLTQPTTTQNSNDPATAQMVGLLNEELEEIGTREEWQEFIGQCSFVTQPNPIVGTVYDSGTGHLDVTVATPFPENMIVVGQDIGIQNITPSTLNGEWPGVSVSLGGQTFTLATVAGLGAISPTGGSLTTGVSDQGDIDTLAGFPVNYILNDVLWDQTQRLPVFGPVSPSRWEQYKALPITGTLLQYRLENNHLIFYPLLPPARHTIIFEAAGSYQIQDNSTNPPTFKRLFTLDTDTCPLPDQILLAALRWRWKREKGLAYAEDKERYENIVADAMARNGTARILNMNGDEENFGPGILVPSGSWNLSGGALPGVGTSV